MTNETQASGPERKRANPDHLHIAPESKQSDQDYQWLAMSVLGKSRADSIHRFTKDGHWAPVGRADMPEEFSDSEDFIQRDELRLFCRPMYLTEEARKEDYEEAYRPVGYLEGVLFGRSNAHPPMRPSPLFSGPALWASDYSPKPVWEPQWERRTRFETEGTTSWGKPKRGRILILHQYWVRSFLRPWLARFWQPLLRCRICYLSYNESEIAERQGTTFGQWAWAKRDLLREGMIPLHRPQFRLTVKTFDVKFPKVPWRQWAARLRAKLKR